MASDQDQAKSIFLNALEIESEADRQEYVQSQCEDDPQLLSEVEGLLQYHQRMGDFLQSPAIPQGATVDMPAVAERPGTSIGPYKLLEKLGEGGMGVVFLAEQKQPVERQVALKIIRPGMDSEQVINRFEAERQALAVMDHPNVAKVLDAGTTESGRPYFVMELVQGTRITKYCDEHQLTVRERLELFIPVCQAVQHAHQKGIIHRDLKPSNILVTEFDGRPVPKVIDFGVAKAIDQPARQKQMSTQYGQIVGTLEYMSPEQARLNQQDVDTRSDVYSLGAVLYELLTGITPFDREELYSAAFDQALHIIEQQEPSKPSTRLSSSDSLPSVAALRHTEPQRLTGTIRGELDWIVMKSLEKERSRRYESAASLARDIDNYLNDQPVIAGPPSAAYRLRKFARRNKGVLATVGLVALAMIVGTSISIYQAVRATKAEKLAESRLEEVDQQREVAEAVADFLTDDLLGQANPWNQPDRNVKLRTILDRASNRIRDRFQDQPLVAAAIHMTLGETYLSLGMYKQSERHIDQAREIRQKRLGLEALSTLRAMTVLANVYVRQRRLDEAEKLLKRVQLHRKTLASMSGLALVEWRRGNYNEAVNRFRKTIEAQERKLGQTHSSTLETVANLAVVYKDQGKYGEAEDLLKKVLELQRRSPGPDHPSTLTTMHNLSSVYLAQDNYDAAEKLLNEALEVERRVLGPEHPLTLLSMGYLAVLYNDRGNWPEAERRFQELLKLHQRAFGREHPVSITTMDHLATVNKNLANFAEAERLLQEALGIQRRLGRTEQPTSLGMLRNLAQVQYGKGDFPAAESAFTEALEIHRRLRGNEHPTTLDCLMGLALAYGSQGKYSEAEAWNKEVVKIRRRVLGNDNPETLASLSNLAALYLDQHKNAEASKILEEVVDTSQSLLGEEHPYTLSSLQNLALVHKRQGKFTQAEELATKVLDARRSRLGTTRPDHPDIFASLRFLASLQATRGEFAKAEDLHREMLDTATSSESPISDTILECNNNLAWFLATCPDQEVRKPEEAVRLATQATEMQPEVASLWNTLGVAQYRSADYESAIQSLAKAVDLGSGGTAADFLFLAMSHWQLGNKEAAQEWYGKAVDQMKNSPSEDEELQRFHEEAKELMGIETDGAEEGEAGDSNETMDTIQPVGVD